ncbi:hypothetical protein HUW63_31250 [Myxococcus sp. AM001]|nr:hypothetical protein [Myxococcus sp. AM001]
MSLGSWFSLLLYLLVAAAVVKGGLAFRKSLQRRDQSWRRFAALRDWGYTHSLGTWEMGGLHLGRQFRIRSEYRRSGDKTRLCTVVTLELGQVLPPDLLIRPEGLGDKLLKAVGKRDEEVGDAEVDAMLNLKNLSDEARDLLRAPRVRQQFQRLRRQFQSFTIEDEQLKAERLGMPDSEEALEDLVSPALLLSEALHEAAEQGRARKRG